MLVAAGVAWLIILAGAVLNGAFREALLVKWLGRRGAFLASGALLSLWIVLVSLALVGWIEMLTTAESLAIGVFWLTITVAFEFAFGRFVEHKPWAELLGAYTFKDGNVWPLVLVVTLFGPLLATGLLGGVG